MKTFLEIIVKSGKTGAELSFYILLPVMVVMMSFMRVMEKKGILKKVAIALTPVFALFGLPGIGVFVILQILLVSFAAPVATLKIIDLDENITERRIAATLAAVLTMSQANATFPLAIVGLNVGVTILTSVLGGLLAGFLTYKVFTRKFKEPLKEKKDYSTKDIVIEKKESIIKIILGGAEEGFQIVLKAIPLLVLAIFFVNVLNATGIINWLGNVLSPVFNHFGLPGVAVLPIVTKYIAGGTAMMGVSLQLVNEGALTAVHINKIAGFTINPLDTVGVAILAASGPRIGKVVVPAIKGALIGILVRGITHLIIF